MKRSNFLAVPVLALLCAQPESVANDPAAHADPALAALTAEPAEQGTPLLKPADVKAISKLFADYFRARMDDDLRRTAKAYSALDKKLVTTAKSKKVESMMVSPVDLRSVYGAPLDPEKGVKKGAFYMRSFTISLQGKPREFQYLLSLPKTYSHDDPIPMVLSLHPQMSREDELKKWAARAYPTPITDVAAVVIPVNIGEDSADWTSMEGRYPAFFAIREMSLKYNINRLALFLDGHAGTAQAANEYAVGYPGMFTAVICRHLDSAPATDHLENARNIKFLLLAPAEGDGAKLVSDFAEDAKAKGVGTTQVTAAIDEDGLPDDSGVAALVELISGTVKQTAPERIHFTTNSDDYVNAYWLHLLKMDVSENQPITIEAEIDRASNEIRVTTPPNVHMFKVYLNDDLIDMGKEIKLIHTVVREEAPELTIRFEGTKTRSFEKSLNTWYNNLSGNFGEVYTNSIEVEVP